MILIVDKRDQILKFRPEYVSTEDCYLLCETRRLSVSSWGGKFLVKQVGDPGLLMHTS